MTAVIQNLFACRLLGSSEVGHLNLGAGRIVFQNLVRISIAIKENRLKDNPAVTACIKHVKKFNSAVHLYGLVQDQGVHAHTDHLIGYLQVLKNAGVKAVYIHVISDTQPFDDVSAAIEDAYNTDQADEFIKPRKTQKFKTVSDNDAVIFFNYRFDRAAEIQIMGMLKQWLTQKPAGSRPPIRLTRSGFPLFPTDPGCKKHISMFVKTGNSQIFLPQCWI